MNTERNPQTFLEVAGLCSSIVKIASHPVVSLHDFHKQLVAAKSKAQVIDILCTRCSAMGWFYDMPEGLWDKLGNLRQQQKR
jgi:hypothetical protein